MKITNSTITLESEGHCHIMDITSRVEEILEKSGLQKGNVIVFVSGSTAAVTTIEYEPGLIRDLPELLDRLIPEGSYHHDATWGDGNGYAHLRSAFIGTSFTVPFAEARLLLGTWQQIVCIDFDNRPRQRRLAVQVMGE